MTVTSKRLLTIADVRELTGLSYPALLRLFKNHRDRIPHEGSGRATRYMPEAVEIFEQLAAETSAHRSTGRKLSGREVK